MFLKLLPITSLLLMTACSSYPGSNTTNRTAENQEGDSTQAEKYSRGRSPLVPVNAIASSNNLCVDNFNFLRQAKSSQYQNYSQHYIKIGDGYKFLNTNKNIMGSDAKEVYTMELDMKLDTLCKKVNYAGYNVIKQKIKELYGI